MREYWLSYAVNPVLAGPVTPAAGREGLYDSGGGSMLAARQFWLQRQRVLHHEPHPSDADIIELNCGGAIMVTSRSTLRQVGFANHNWGGLPTP